MRKEMEAATKTVFKEELQVFKNVLLSELDKRIRPNQVVLPMPEGETNPTLPAPNVTRGRLALLEETRNAKVAGLTSKPLDLQFGKDEPCRPDSPSSELELAPVLELAPKPMAKKRFSRMVPFVSEDKDRSIGLDGKAARKASIDYGIPRNWSSRSEDDEASEDETKTPSSGETPDRGATLQLIGNVETSSKVPERRHKHVKSTWDTIVRAISTLVRTSAWVVNSGLFVNFTGLVIILNMLFIGLDIDYDAKHWDSHAPKPPQFKYIDLAFFAYFVVELLLRIIAENVTFVTEVHNWMDTMLVALQGTEVVHEFHLVSSSGFGSNKGLALIRMLRVARMSRVLRLLRILTIFEELSSLADSMIQSFKPLVWVMVMVLLVTYVAGVLLTHIVAQFRTLAKDNVDGEVHESLNKYYGSLSVTMLVLYEIVSAGEEWGRVLEPAMDHISPYICSIFIAYTAFVFFAMMNVVTSYFVDNTIRAVEESRGSNMGMALWEAFKDPNGEPLDSITDTVFYAHLHTPEMQRYLASIDISPETCEDNRLFQMLDVDGGGELNSDELIRGCMRLRGNARQIDLHCFAFGLRAEMEALSNSVSMLHRYHGFEYDGSNIVETEQPVAVRLASKKKKEAKEAETTECSFMRQPATRREATVSLTPRYDSQPYTALPRECTPPEWPEFPRNL